MSATRARFAVNVQFLTPSYTMHRVPLPPKWLREPGHSRRRSNHFAGKVILGTASRTTGPDIPGIPPATDRAGAQSTTPAPCDMPQTRLTLERCLAAVFVTQSRTQPATPHSQLRAYRLASPDVPPAAAFIIIAFSCPSAA